MESQFPFWIKVVIIKSRLQSATESMLNDGDDPEV